eukprot:g3116.t1
MGRIQMFGSLVVLFAAVQLTFSTDSKLFETATSVLDMSWNSTHSFTKIDDMTGYAAQSSTVSLLVATANALRYFQTKGNGEKENSTLFDRALLELRTVMGSQWADTGMMPHLIYPNTSPSRRSSRSGRNSSTDGGYSTNDAGEEDFKNFTDRVYVPTASFWGTHANGRSKSTVATSGLASLPLHGTTAWKLYNAAPNETVRKEIGEMASSLVDWHTYLWKERRDANASSSDGLIYLLHPWESVSPYLPAWNATSRIDECDGANYSYPSMVSNDPRFVGKKSYDSELCRIECLARDAYRGSNATRCGFAVSSLVFSSIFLRSNKDLVKLMLAEGIGTGTELSGLDSMSRGMQTALEQASLTPYVYDRSTRQKFDVGLTRYATVFADGLGYVEGTVKYRSIDPSTYTYYMDWEFLFPLYAAIWTPPSFDGSTSESTCIRYNAPLSLLYHGELVVSVLPMFTWMVTSGFRTRINASLYGDYLQNQTLGAFEGILNRSTQPFLPYGARADNDAALITGANDTNAASTVVLFMLPDAPDTTGFIKAPFGSIGTIVFVFFLLLVILGVGCIFFGTTLKLLHAATFDVANDKSPSGMLQRPLIASSIDDDDFVHIGSPRSAAGRRTGRTATGDMADCISTPALSTGPLNVPGLVAGGAESGDEDGWYAYFTKHLRV